MEKCHSWTMPTVAIACMLGTLLTVYTAGYIVRGELHWGDSRVFPTKVEAIIFVPAAKVESLITRKTVSSHYGVPPPPPTSDFTNGDVGMEEQVQ